MSLSRNIRYLRKKQGWGQDKLADELGYKSYTTIQKWESGVSEPPLKVVHAIASLFNVDINDLTNSDLETGKGATTGDQEPDILDEVDLAFYGNYKELSEANKETLRAMARVLLEQESKG